MDAPRQHHHAPPIAIYEGVVSPEEAAALVRAADALLAPPLLSGESLAVDRSVRTGDLAWLQHDHDPVVQRVCERVASLLGRPLDHAEQLQVVRYMPNERYLAHYDSYDMSTLAGRRCTARGGQRMLTALLYLHPPEAGGATVFPRLGIRVEPVLGRMLVFENTGADASRPHPDTLHEGAPVLGGQKWIANLWFRARHWRGPHAWVDEAGEPEVQR